MAINFGAINKPNNDSKPMENAKPSVSFTAGKVYDLDDLIAAKRKAESFISLTVKVIDNEAIQTKILEYCTMVVLNKFNVKYDATNYKTQISKVPNFDLELEKTYTQYYNAFKPKYIDNGLIATVSLDTVQSFLETTEREYGRNLTNANPYSIKPTTVGVGTSNRPTTLWEDATVQDSPIQPDKPITERIDNLEDEVIAIHDQLDDHEKRIHRNEETLIDHKNAIQNVEGLIDQHNDRIIKNTEDIKNNYNEHEVHIKELYEVNATVTQPTLDKHTEEIKDLGDSLQNGLQAVNERVDDNVDELKRLDAKIDNTVDSLDNYYNKEQVDEKVADLVDSAPGTLDTLKELAQALGDDPNFSVTITNKINAKANKSDVYTKTHADNVFVNKVDYYEEKTVIESNIKTNKNDIKDIKDDYVRCDMTPHYDEDDLYVGGGTLAEGVYYTENDKAYYLNGNELEQKIIDRLSSPEIAMTSEVFIPEEETYIESAQPLHLTNLVLNDNMKLNVEAEDGNVYKITLGELRAFLKE